MKKYFLGLITSLMFICGFSQNYFLAAPEGYGAATSGGGNSAPVTVSTYADLKANLKSAGAKVILVSGEITIHANGVISEIITDKCRQPCNSFTFRQNCSFGNGNNFFF